MSRFLYMESCARMKGKAAKFAKTYRRLAIVELAEGFEGRPAMCSERAKGVARIVTEWSGSVGATERSEGFVRRRDMQARVAELNAGGV